MKKSHSLWLHLGLWTGFLTCASSCGSKFLQDASTEPRQTATDRHQIIKADSKTEADPTPVAAEPVAIGGTYLSCWLNPRQAESTDLPIACEANAPDADAQRAAAVQFAFSQGVARASAVPLAEGTKKLSYDAANKRWHWDFSFPRLSLKGPKLFIDVKDAEQLLDTPLQVEISVLEAQPLTLQATRTLIGDTVDAVAVNANQADPALKVLGDCQNLDPALQPKSTTVSYSFEVTSPLASLEVELQGVCGISVESNGIDKVQVAGADQKVYGSVLLARSVPSQKFMAPNLPKGLYSLSIISNIINAQADDFIIDTITLRPLNGLIVVK